MDWKIIKLEDYLESVFCKNDIPKYCVMSTTIDNKETYVIVPLLLVDDLSVRNKCKKDMEENLPKDCKVLIELILNNYVGYVAHCFEVKMAKHQVVKDLFFSNKED